jgi:hypothetical protein
VASVRRCIDCDVVLVEDTGSIELEVPVAESSSGTPVGTGEQVAYELEGWGNQLKVTLAGMLERAGIPAVWEAAALVVPASFEARVDQLVATVEGGEAPDLDDEAPQVAFDLDELTADELADLDARLIAASIPHAWEEASTALLVAEVDEEQVAELIDDVLNPADDLADDGLAVHEALSVLYVVVDKLQKEPFDAKLGVRCREAVEALAGLGVPYGMASTEWADLRDHAAEVVAAIGPDAQRDEDAGDDAAEEPATVTVATTRCPPRPRSEHGRWWSTCGRAWSTSSDRSLTPRQASGRVGARRR